MHYMAIYDNAFKALPNCIELKHMFNDLLLHILLQVSETTTISKENLHKVMQIQAKIITWYSHQTSE